MDCIDQCSLPTYLDVRHPQLDCSNVEELDVSFTRSSGNGTKPQEGAHGTVSGAADCVAAAPSEIY